MSHFAICQSHIQRQFGEFYFSMVDSVENRVANSKAAAAAMLCHVSKALSNSAYLLHIQQENTAKSVNFLQSRQIGPQLLAAAQSVA